MSNKRGKQKQTCYACDRIESSREHVPPLCFFPEMKDIPNQLDLRRNLIRVPACDEHNLKKSGDDQYLLAIIPTEFEGNEFAQQHFSTKVFRTLRRRPHLARSFYGELIPAELDGTSTFAFHVDLARFERAVALIAKGIFFHHFDEKFLGEVIILTASLVNINSSKRNEINQALIDMRRNFDHKLLDFPRYGENEPIFYYQVHDISGYKWPSIRMVFYEGARIDTFFPT